VLDLAAQQITEPQAPYSEADILARRQAHLDAHPPCTVVRWVPRGTLAVMVQCTNDARIEQSTPKWSRLVCGTCEGSALHAVSGVTVRMLGVDQ
jgi:endonuclease YncB( thermonuclease family)